MTPIIITALMLTGAALVAVSLRMKRTDPVSALVAEFEESGLAAPTDAYSARLDEPLVTRLFAPLADAAASLAAKVLPSTSVEDARDQLTRAGLSSRVTPEEFAAFRLLSAVGGGLFAVAGVLAVPGLQGIALALLFVFLGFAIPRGYLDRARDARVMEIERALPDSFDLLAICVEAGLGFEQALATVVEQTDTALSEELGHTLREMQLGRSRVDALRGLQRRVAVPDIDSLVLALIQADALGMPLTKILRSQSAELRRRRRQRVREAAAKVPVKMIIPMAAFILPALFAIVLGPALILFRSAF